MDQSDNKNERLTSQQATSPDILFYKDSFNQSAAKWYNDNPLTDHVNLSFRHYRNSSAKGGEER